MTFVIFNLLHLILLVWILLFVIYQDNHPCFLIFFYSKIIWSLGDSLSYNNNIILWAIACQAPLSMGILQARIMEWVVMPSSRGSSWPKDWTHVSMSPSLAGRFFTTSTTWEAHLSFNPLFITFLCYAGFLLFVDIRFKIYTDGMFTYISGTEASRAFRLLLNYRFLGFIPCQYPVLTKLESLEPGLRNVYFK